MWAHCHELTASTHIRVTYLMYRFTLTHISIRLFSRWILFHGIIFNHIQCFLHIFIDEQKKRKEAKTETTTIKVTGNPIWNRILLEFWLDIHILYSMDSIHRQQNRELLSRAPHVEWMKEAFNEVKILI